MGFSDLVDTTFLFWLEFFAGYSVIVETVETL